MTKTNIRYFVDDVDAAIDFYTGMLDFKVQMHPAPGFAALERHGLQLLLNQPGAGGAGESMPDGETPKPGGWNRLQIKTDDLDSMYAGLKEKGATFRNEIVEGKGGKQVLLQDPSGNLIELFEAIREQSVQPVSEGFSTITPYLLVKGAEKLITFIKEAFNGKVEYMMRSDDGIRYSNVRIGDSMLMISDAPNEPIPCMLHLYVHDVDAVYEQAVKAGGESLREPKNEFYGDRSAGVKDDWGNTWWLATRIEDVSEEEMKRREKESRVQDS